ncbi:hypothetical protein GCM10027610_098880 [Dactylosporangium cerinum]
MARGAVDPVQLAAVREDLVTAAGLLDLLVEALRARQLRAAAQLLDVGAELGGLVLVELRRLALGLRLLAGQWHAARVDLELHGGGTDADEARSPVLHALGVAAMAGDAADLVDRLAVGRRVGQLHGVLGAADARCVRRVEAARERERRDQAHSRRQPPAQLAPRRARATRHQPGKRPLALLRSHGLTFVVIT